jgi:hypothetical protein
MSNLTFDEKLIREHRAEPLEGHTVVVLERMGESGERFHSLLEPGDDVPRKTLIDYLRRKPTVYSAYAVDASRHRQLSFSASVQMAEHARALDLDFSLWYRVSDPHLLVASRTGDPLGRVRARVMEVVTEEMAELPWTEVWHAFRTTADRLVDGAMGTLKAFAREHGLSIGSLRLRPRFREEDIQVEGEIHRFQQKGRLGKVRVDVWQDLEDYRRQRKLDSAALEDEEAAMMARRRHWNAVTTATTDRIVGLIGESPSMAEVREVHAALGGPSGNGFGLHVHGGAGGSGAIGPAGPALAALPSGEAGLPGVLADLVAHTHFRPDAQSRRVRAALLHLVAAVVADDSLQLSPEVAEHARCARTEVDAAAHLPGPQAEALQALADPQRLRQRLYP